PKIMQPKSPAMLGGGGITPAGCLIAPCRSVTSINWASLGWPRDLNSPNRPVRTRMPGGVAGVAESPLRAPMPILPRARWSGQRLGKRFLDWSTGEEGAIVSKNNERGEGMRRVVAALMWTTVAASGALAGSDHSNLPNIRFNQLGFEPEGPKRAVVKSVRTSPRDWRLVDADGAEVASGKTTVFGINVGSGAHVHHIDFSGVRTAGAGYRRSEERRVGNEGRRLKSA